MMPPPSPASRSCSAERYSRGSAGHPGLLTGCNRWTAVSQGAGHGFEEELSADGVVDGPAGRLRVGRPGFRRLTGLFDQGGGSLRRRGFRARKRVELGPGTVPLTHERRLRVGPERQIMRVRPARALEITRPGGQPGFHEQSG